jgi:hypothetical protein
MPWALTADAAAGPEMYAIHAAAAFSSFTVLATAALITILSVSAGGSGERYAKPGTMRSSAI